MSQTAEQSPIYQSFMNYSAGLALIGCGTLGLPAILPISHTAITGWALLSSALILSIGLKYLKLWPGVDLIRLNIYLLLLAGLTFLFNSFTPIVSISVLMISIFVIEGCIKAGLSLRLQPQSRWHAMGLISVAAFVFAYMLVTSWPLPMPWLAVTFPILVGCYLVAQGLGWLLYGMKFR